MKMTRMPNDGLYFDEEFRPPRTPGYLFKIGLVYAGMFLSVMLFAAGLLGLVWLLGQGAQAVSRWIGG